MPIDTASSPNEWRLEIERISNNYDTNANCCIYQAMKAHIEYGFAIEGLFINDIKYGNVQHTS